jgi:hypothetical protein
MEVEGASRSSWGELAAGSRDVLLLSESSFSSWRSYDPANCNKAISQVVEVFNGVDGRPAVGDLRSGRMDETAESTREGELHFFFDTDSDSDDSEDEPPREGGPCVVGTEAPTASPAVVGVSKGLHESSSSGDFQDPRPVEQRWSVGSKLHDLEACRPCAWAWRSGGCSKQQECKFCHTCAPGALKARKKERVALLRAEEKIIRKNPMQTKLAL